MAIECLVFFLEVRDPGIALSNFDFFGLQLSFGLHEAFGNRRIFVREVGNAPIVVRLLNIEIFFELTVDLL